MDNNTTPSYSAMVAAARLAARDTLRARNIHKWVRVNADLNLVKAGLLKGIQDHKDNMLLTQKEVARQEYAISKLDQADPDFAQKSEAAERALAQVKQRVADEEVSLANLIKNVTKETTMLDEEIAENKAKIHRWENGTNKVQLSNLNDLAREYVEMAMKDAAMTKILAAVDGAFQENVQAADETVDSAE